MFSDLKSFVREENSLKWMKHRNHPNAFDFSVADMDFGFMKGYYDRIMK